MKVKTALYSNKLFIPTDLGANKIKFWNDSYTLSSISLRAGSTDVAQWSDLSGNGNHLVQANASYQPSLDPTNSSITFASGDFMANSLVVSALPYSLFCVVDNDKSSGGSSIIASGQTAGNGTFYFNGADNYKAAMYADNAVVAGSGETTKGLYRFEVNGTTSDIIGINGTPANVNAGSALCSSFFVGKSPAASLFVGKMYSLILVTGELSGAEVYKLEGYLAYRFNLQASLPATHPYKIKAP